MPLPRPTKGGKASGKINFRVFNLIFRLTKGKSYAIIVRAWKKRGRPRQTKAHISRRSEGGIAPVSGLNHRSRRRIFEKSRKPLKTLTFSALPNVEKSSISRSDHMFDHLQKKYRFTPIGVWLSLVERLLREQEVASSNLVTPTTYD